MLIAMKQQQTGGLQSLQLIDRTPEVQRFREMTAKDIRKLPLEQSHNLLLKLKEGYVRRILNLVRKLMLCRTRKTRQEAAERVVSRPRRAKLRR